MYQQPTELEQLVVRAEQRSKQAQTDAEVVTRLLGMYADAWRMAEDSRREQRQQNGRVARRSPQAHLYDVLCAECGQPNGDHAYVGDFCPNVDNKTIYGSYRPLFLPTKFSPLLCQWEEPETREGACDSVACGAPMTIVEIDGGGMGYCEKHYRQTRRMYGEGE